jgi:hypothetical protein
MAINNYCACTPVCEEDAVRWLDQYLAEVERLQCFFALHFDHCSHRTKEKARRHPAFLGATSNDDPQTPHAERHRAGPYGVAKGHFCVAALTWDIDETWEKDAPAKFDAVLNNGLHWDAAKVHWINLWGDERHIRTDNPSNAYRDRLLRLDSGIRWHWRGPIIVDPYADKCWESVRVLKTDLVCLHHGLMTRELRLQHKKRWDRVYGHFTSDGKNPYGYWDYILDEEAHPPVIEENKYR